MQQSLLSLILDVIPYVVFWKDRDSKYLGVNRNFALLAGKASPADVIGLNDYDMPWTKEESDAYRADDREVMTTGKPKLHIVETQLNAEGKRTWLDTSKVPLRNVSGEVIGVLGIYADITELKETESSLQKTRQRLEDAIDAIDAGLVMFDAEERLVFCNERYRQIYSEVRDQMQPGAPYEGILQAFIQKRTDLLDGIDGAAWVRERLEQHGRCERWEQVLGERVIMVSDRRTRDQGVVSLRTDITAEKVRQRELQRAKEAAVAASQAKTNFLANLSHEIRTPMSAILGFTDVLLDSGPRADQVDSLRTIQRNTEHLLSLINDILDLSKIEVGKLNVERESVGLMKLVRDVHTLMRPKAIDRGLKLDVVFEGVLPQHLESDATRLRQILVNLVGNALKFTEKGRVVVRVVADGDRALKISVEDTGIGIAAQNLDRVFEAFEQADVSTTRRYGGTGLGLSISRQLARLLGGDITATSVLGQGSVFTLRHPVPEGVAWIEPKPPVQETKAAPASGGSGEAPLQGRACLLVEDGPDNQRLFSHYLRSMGAYVELAVDGQVAVETVTKAGVDAFDLILMDMQMPRLDGYSATQQLRAAGCRVPILALTAHAMAGDRERCLAAGCDDYLSKPLRRQALLESALYWLGRKKSPASPGEAPGGVESKPPVG